MVEIAETYKHWKEPITGANALAQQGYGAYNPWLHELHFSLNALPQGTSNPQESLFIINGRPLTQEDLVEIDGQTYTSPFQAMFDLWYSQTDDTVITEGLEDFEVEGILEDFLLFAKNKGMHPEVYDFNVKKYIEMKSPLPPDTLNYPLYEPIKLV